MSTDLAAELATRLAETLRERNELHHHVAVLVYAATGRWCGCAMEPVAPQVEAARKAINALGEALDEARAELACECNGGKPCACPDCECPDCSYQQPEAESAPVCGEGNPVCGEPVPDGSCSEHGEVGPPTTDDAQQWNPGDYAMTSLDYVWRRDTDGWRPYTRTDGTATTDTGLANGAGPLTRIAAPAETSSTGRLPKATANELRDKARNGYWCQPCGDYIPHLSTHWHCTKCGRLTSMLGHFMGCPPKPEQADPPTPGAISTSSDSLASGQAESSGAT